MSGLEVAAVVSSILTAFGNGLDVFKRMRAKQKDKKRSREAVRLTQEEQQIHNSLQRAPRDIRAEYDRNVVQLGHRFQIGDTVAHTSLAHILLQLNTGLINIINHALSEDPRARNMSRKSLLGLSEIAAADTVHALSQLNKRLTSAKSLPNQAQLQSVTHHRKKRKSPKQEGAVATTTKRTIPQAKAKKRPEADPLARGGWVRSKSGTSIVSSGSSTPRPAKPERTNSSQSVAQESSVNKSESRLSDSTTLHGSPSCACQASFSHPNVEADFHRHLQHGQRQQPQEPDLWLASPDAFDAELPPPRPPKIPIHRVSSGRRPRPPSVATFLTASTKIGEIPEHRWLDRPALPWDNRPLPYVIPPPLEPEPAKKKAKGFKSCWKNCIMAERNVKSKTLVADI